MTEWKNTHAFALALIRESKKNLYNNNEQQQKIVGERIAILHLDHANELLMKSFLEKEGYIIDYLEMGSIRKGLKITDKERELRSLSYRECLDLVSKELKIAQRPLSNEKKNAFWSSIN